MNARFPFRSFRGISNATFDLVFHSYPASRKLSEAALKSSKADSRHACAKKGSSRIPLCSSPAPPARRCRRGHGMCCLSYVYPSSRGHPLLFIVLPWMFAFPAFLPMERSTSRRLVVSDLQSRIPQIIEGSSGEANSRPACANGTGRHVFPSPPGLHLRPNGRRVHGMSCISYVYPSYGQPLLFSVFLLLFLMTWDVMEKLTPVLL
ncbi:hypothetical protein B0H11DRAFT_724217 [Mycena galericulata]|nr:hypothetical protein B0H11DRAFT_724217 [Mycena galericulata]